MKLHDSRRSGVKQKIEFLEFHWQQNKQCTKRLVKFGAAIQVGLKNCMHSQKCLTTYKTEDSCSKYLLNSCNKSEKKLRQNVFSCDKY